MVVKAIINAIGKSNKPKKFPIGTEKFTKEESKTLLEEAQGKIEKIQSGEAKAIDTGGLVPQDVDYLSVKTSTVAPNLQPKKVNYKVNPPKPSSKKAVDEFLQEEEKILKNADLDGNESDILNFNKIQSSDDVLASIRALGNQYKSGIIKQTRGVVSWKETNELAELLGENSETLAGNLLKLRPGSTLNATEIKAAKNLLIYQHKILTEIAQKLRTGAASDDLALEFARQHAVTAELTKVFKGAQTEIARALNILKEPVQEGRVVNLDLDRLNRSNILMNLGGKKQIEAIEKLKEKEADIYAKHRKLKKELETHIKSFNFNNRVNLVLGYHNDLEFVDYGHQLKQEVTDKLALALLEKGSTERLPQIIKEITEESV